MTTIISRFLPKINKVESGCWLWTAAITRNGYATISVGGKRVLAHRWAYEYFIGVVPEGFVLDHLCRVRHCVNPEHLEPVSQQENILRGNGMAAQRARQTHCHRGHKLVGANLRLKKNGNRICRECTREYQREWRRNDKH